MSTRKEILKEMLSEAIMNKNEKEVKGLLELGAQFEPTDFLDSVKSGNVKIAKMLLDHLKRNIIPDDENEMTLWDQIVDSIYESDDHWFEGNTLLQCAIDSKNKKMVEFILNEGADVHEEHSGINSIGIMRDMPIHYAILSGDVEIVKTLIERGADVNEGDGAGNTPLHYVIYSGSNNLKLVELLIKHGADPNSKAAEECFTPIHLAVVLNNVKMVKTLLKYGANPDGLDPHFEGVDSYGDTPLHFALGGFEDGRTLCYEDHYKGFNLEITKVLLEAGADVTIKNSKGNTPLDIAEVDFFTGEIINEIISNRKKGKKVTAKVNVTIESKEEKEALKKQIRAQIKAGINS